MLKELATVLAVAAVLPASANDSRRLQAPAGGCVDLDGSGDVTVTDLLLLLAAFGTGGAGDTDGDGATDVTDLLNLLAGFGVAGSCTPTAPGGGAGNVAFADIRMNTCYTFANADGLDVRWHETDPTGQCHNGRPVYATVGSVGTTNDRFKFVPSLCTTGGQCGGTATGSAQSGNTISIESCATPATYLRHCYYHIWAGAYGNGPNYDFTWVMQQGDVPGSIILRTTADQFGARDIEVIPDNAPFSNVGQNNGAREYGLTMVMDGVYQNWFVQETEDNSGAPQMLGGDGPLPQSHTLLTTIPSLPLDYQIGLDITPGSNIRGDWAAIVHFTATDTNCCDYGTRVPGVWFWPGTRKILVVDGHGANGNSHTGEWGCDDALLTTADGVQVNLKMVMASDVVTIYINDAPACTATRADRQIWPNVKVYLPALWGSTYPAADVTIGNLYYCEGVCAASVDPCFGITPPGSDTICPATTGTWHSTVDTSTYDPSNVCFIGAATGGTNCNTYCAALGRNCMQAQDNVGECGIGGDHTRQDMSDNGCNQNWGGQICGCSGAAVDGVPSVNADGYGMMDWQGDSWYLVRRTTGSKWHVANDEAQGDADAYGGYNPDPTADPSAFNIEYASWPWDKMLMSSGDMSEWVILPRTLVDGFGETGTPSCDNCIMPLLGTSQGNLDALQYMRPGAQEDPWISSGHHPDQIVYGENGDANSWHTGAGDALQMGGANVWVNAIGALPPTTPPADPCAGLTIPAGDTVCPQTTGTWHNTVDTSQYDPNAVCFIGAATGGTNCNAYCNALGRDCMQAQDNVGACGIGGDHTRQDMSQNGCNQNWGGQICGCAGPDPRIITCSDVSQPNVTPTQCYDDVAADVPLWMDRNYAWTTGPTDVLTGGWTYFRVSLEPQAGAPCSDPQNPTQNGREGGFNGNIAKPATIAICCANHCGSTNTPIDLDVLTANPQSTLTWIVHPGTFAITGHGGAPCTFYETTVPQGDYTFCCSTCWGSGLFLTSVADALSTGTVCDSLNANDYSSWSVMANNGWTHETSGDAHLSDMTHSGVAGRCQEGANWFGWSHNAEVGRLWIPLPGAGTGTVDFGNCWSDPGDVVLYIDGVEAGRAGPSTQHVVVTIVFQAGSILLIQDEGQNSVAKLSSISLTCTGDTPLCSEATTVTVTGSTSTDMNSAGACSNCGQPRWFELAELKLFDIGGNNIAPNAVSVDLLMAPSNPEAVGVITDGAIFDWSAGTFVVWQNSMNFHGEALVRLTFSAPQVIVGAELYSTNYESFGTNAQVFAGSRSLPTRFVYSAHNNQGAAHAACYMNGQEFPTPCSTDDGEPGVGSMDNCGMDDAIKDGFAHLTMFSQDWYLVRRDHSIEDGWHPVNDDLTGTAPAYGTFSTDPLADETWSVPFGDAYTELLLASGDMSMWVTIERSELAARCGSCSNCQMTLTGSSGLGQPRQYCRAGSGEDPWISAGDHPDLIVYGEMSWASHHIGQDGSEDALQRGGSNVWVNALPAASNPCDGITAPGGDTICEAITGGWHNTVDATGYDGGAICFIGAATGGSTCNDYCTTLGRPCFQAQDNVGACGIGGDHTRQDMSQNGCNQNWGGQICGCGMPGEIPPWQTAVVFTPAATPIITVGDCRTTGGAHGHYSTSNGNTVADADGDGTADGIDDCIAACVADDQCHAFDMDFPFQGTCWFFHNGPGDHTGNGVPTSRCYTMDVASSEGGIWEVTHTDSRVIDPQENRDISPWEWRSNEFTLDQCKAQCLQNPTTCSGIEFEDGGSDGSSDCILLRGIARTTNFASGWTIYAVPFDPSPQCAGMTSTALVVGGVMGSDPNEHGGAWTGGGSDATGGFITQQGTGTFLRFDMPTVGTGDWTSTMKIVLTSLGSSAATFEFNQNSHFGFEGSCNCVFAEGPFYGAFQNMGPPGPMGIVDGAVLDFVVQRTGDQFTIYVNGDIVQTHTSSIPITSIGLRPHRATMRLYEWNVDSC